MNDTERHSDADRLYVLRAGRRGHGDVAVFSNGRNLGRLPPTAADPLGAVLTKLGGAAVVNGTGAGASGIRLWVDVPEIEAAEAFAAHWQVRE